MRRAPLLACCALAASLFGCQRSSDCAALLDAMRPQLAEIERLHGGAPGGEPPSPEALRAVGEAYLGLDRGLERVESSDVKVMSVVSEYRAMARDLASAYQSMAAAIEKEDSAKAKSAAETLDRVHAREWATMGIITTSCGEH